MKNIFLVCGYGVPKNILVDENYNFYLKIVLNKIYSLVTKNKIDQPLIILAGGKTDIFKPYKRTEAGEMIKLFKNIIKQKPFLKPITKNWLFVAENTSISTLENLLNAQQIISQRKIKQANVFVFCEQTREQRIKILAKKILAKNCSFQVVPIDFDISANRYLPSEYLSKKENAELKHCFWALQKPENLKQHHEMVEEKLKFFRQADWSKNTNAVIKSWWDQKAKELMETKKFN